MNKIEFLARDLSEGFTVPISKLVAEHHPESVKDVPVEIGNVNLVLRKMKAIRGLESIRDTTRLENTDLTIYPYSIDEKGISLAWLMLIKEYVLLRYRASWYAHGVIDAGIDESPGNTEHMAFKGYRVHANLWENGLLDREQTLSLRIYLECGYPKTCENSVILWELYFDVVKE